MLVLSSLNLIERYYLKSKQTNKRVLLLLYENPIKYFISDIHMITLIIFFVLKKHPLVL